MHIVTSPAVAHAFIHRQPLVALESTVIAHGLPYPHNVEVARAMELLKFVGIDAYAAVAARSLP